MFSMLRQRQRKHVSVREFSNPFVTYIRHRFFIATSLQSFFDCIISLYFLHFPPSYISHFSISHLLPPLPTPPTPLYLGLLPPCPPSLTRVLSLSAVFLSLFFLRNEKMMFSFRNYSMYFFLLNFPLFYRGVKLDDESVKSHLRPIQMNDFIVAVEKSKSNTDFHR